MKDIDSLILETDKKSGHTYIFCSNDCFECPVSVYNFEKIYPKPSTPYHTGCASALIYHRKLMTRKLEALLWNTKKANS